MKRLTDIPVDELQRALASVDDKKPAQRLIAGIAYKNGVTQSELAEWFDVERKTIYNWLTRLETGDFESAIRDEERPGRPRKISTEQWATLEATLRGSPADVGYDAPAWTTDLVREFVRDRFDVEYSRPSCRRLMKEAGLRYRPVRNDVAEADPDDFETDERGLGELDHVWLPSGRRS